MQVLDFDVRPQQYQSDMCSANQTHAVSHGWRASMNILAGARAHFSCSRHLQHCVPTTQRQISLHSGAARLCVLRFRGTQHKQRVPDRVCVCVCWLAQCGCFIKPVFLPKPSSPAAKSFFFPPLKREEKKKSPPKFYKKLKKNGFSSLRVLACFQQNVS